MELSCTGYNDLFPQVSWLCLCFENSEFLVAFFNINFGMLS